MSSKNQVDFIVRRLLLFSRLFTKSWGTPETLTGLKHGLDNYLRKRRASELFAINPPNIVITREWQTEQTECLDGHFLSPLANHYPQIYPTLETQICHWRGHFVRNWKSRKGLIIILAPTGDHTFTLRERSFTSHLLNHGISSILVENPFYGRRKPPDQFRSALLNVSDLYVMGASLIVECNFLLKWAREMGYSPLGLTGVSLGGYTAGLIGTNSTEPVAIIPCLSWTSAAPVYTRGALADAINWENLTNQLRDTDYMKALARIPNCDWLEKLESKPPWPGLCRTKSFMWILMDQFTCLEQYPTPIRPDLANFVIAQNDAYIEREGAPELDQIWPGSSVDAIPDVGHVLGYLQHQEMFRDAVIRMLQKAGNSA